MILHKTIVSPRMREYLSEVLLCSDIGQHAISRILEWNAYIYFPTHNIDRNATFNLEASSSSQKLGAQTNRDMGVRTLTNVIIAYLSAGNKNCVILEDFLTKPYDKWFKSNTLRYFTHNERIFYPVDHSEAEDRITTIIEQCDTGLRLTAYFLELVDNALPVSGANINDDDLYRLNSRLQMCCCEIFDGENFIFLKSKAAGTHAMLPDAFNS